MLSFAIKSASTYFHLPIDEDEDDDIQNYNRKFITCPTDSPSTSSSSLASSSSSYSSDSPFSDPIPDTVRTVLDTDNLYDVLGVSNQPTIDKIALRRAYLARSKACHPDKFPDNPDATRAFQKVAVAYDILSKPALRRLYDERSPSEEFDVFAARPKGHADETFRAVVIGVFNDFLDGDLEVIRSLLKAINDINPSIRLGEEGINSVLVALETIRERALTCRTCIYALHAELSRLLEVQHAFRQLSYWDLMGRSRLTLRLTRITLSLPLALERALLENGGETRIHGGKPSEAALMPRSVLLLIRAVDGALERMEKVLR